MPRYWALRLVSLILQICGFVWMLFSIFSVFALAVSASGAPVVEQTVMPLRDLTLATPQPFPTYEISQQFTALFSGATVFALVFGFLSSIFFGLGLIAAGQYINLQIDIERNTRRTAAATAAVATR